jgi:hypothetical protein
MKYITNAVGCGKIFSTKTYNNEKFVVPKAANNVTDGRANALQSTQIQTL